jgi:hypothetical protein
MWFVQVNNPWKARDLAGDILEWFLLAIFGELDIWDYIDFNWILETCVLCWHDSCWRISKSWRFAGVILVEELRLEIDYEHLFLQN